MPRPSRGSRKRRQKARKKAFEVLWRLGIDWQAAITQCAGRGYKVHLVKPEFGVNTHGNNAPPTRTACGLSEVPIRRGIDPFNPLADEMARSYGVGGLCKQCISVVTIGPQGNSS